MGNWINDLKGLIWTLAGTAMVLITLSGATLKRGVWITLITLGLYLGLTVVTQEGERDE